MAIQRHTTPLFPIALVLSFVVLIEGFISIAIEILTIRQLLPVAGGSVVVTSLIIGVFLLFLALGYQRGGRACRTPQKNLQRNFFIAAVWLGIGLSYLFIALFFYAVQEMTGPHIVYALLAYLLIIIAPLIYLLGQTVPMTMNMIKQDHTAGKIGGDTLSLSTIGSFLGAIITTLVLMSYLGVAWTIVICSTLLLFLAFLLSEKKSLATKLFNAACCIAVIYYLNIRVENTFFLLTNNYANYQLLDQNNSVLKDGQKVLIINEAISSYIDNNKQAFPYIETIKRILFDNLKLRNADILVLGAGGFTLSAENTYNNRLTFVDIDRKINDTINPLFADQANNIFVADDARHYVKYTHKQYAAIVVDVYSDIKSIPSHLITQEYLLEVKQRLTANGTVLFNIIANPLLADNYSKRIDNTIRSVFHNCMVMPEKYANQLTNIIYVCRNNTKTNDDSRAYSDNLNNSTTDSFSW